MFIRLLYGESRAVLLNPNCTARIFIDYIKKTCKFDAAAIIDLCDEQGNLANIHTKQATDNIVGLMVPRGTYMPVLIEKNPDDSIKNVLPLLVNWDKKYGSLEKKLKQHTSAAEKPKKPANEGKSKRQREKDKLSERLAADKSLSSKSTMSANPGEISQKTSNMSRIGRKK